MIRTTVLTIAALAAGTTAISPAGAKPATRTVTATWHADMGAEGRYCVRVTHLETAAMTGTRIYQRTCRTARAWQDRGVTFARRVPGA